MITHSLNGVVSHKLRGKLTVLLTTGAEVEVKFKHTTLRLGERVNVAFNNETGRVASITSAHEVTSDPQLVEIPAWDKHPLLEDSPFYLELEEEEEEGECSRGQGFEGKQGRVPHGNNATSYLNLLEIDYYE